MNVLIIGNGFDIAHELPTQYMAFLDFITLVDGLESYHGTINLFKTEGLNKKYANLDIDVQKYFDDLLDEKTNKLKNVNQIWDEMKADSNKVDRIINIEEMIKCSKDNIWIKWFCEKANINPNWIDFEAEISRVVQKFEKLQITVFQAQKGINTNELDDFDSKLIALFTNHKIPIKELTDNHFAKFKKRMLDDLNSLIRCFEIYLEDCVKKIDKKLLSTDIYDLKVDKLLSFNYTDTYQRLYECNHRNIEYDYIHGKANIDSSIENNMVLGIDDYLTGAERFSNTDFIEFKKFYQRLHKKTGCTYKRWIEKINSGKIDNNNVYIYGHSLAMTDKDVLSEFILNEKTKVTIFYYSKEQYSQQIINLVHMIGPDKLNDMVYGVNPKIVFKPQTNMINISDSEWEILNDRNLIWSIHNLNDKKKTELIEKLKDKSNKLDKSYFYNQRNVISIYDALVTTCDTDYGMHDNLMRIAESLFDKENHIEFDSYDWAEPDYRGTLYCDGRTQQFIYDINTMNDNILAKIDDSVCIDDLCVLLKKLRSTSISEERALELFDELLEQFKLDIDDCSIVWDCIYKIQDKCPKVDWRKLTEEKMENASGFEKMRYRHIIDAIDEEEYFEEQAKAQAEYEARQAMEV